jgi:hypothetical protein
MGMPFSVFLTPFSISSIKLDKMKKRQIRRFMLCWIAGTYSINVIPKPIDSLYLDDNSIFEIS